MLDAAQQPSEILPALTGGDYDDIVLLTFERFASLHFILPNRTVTRHDAKPEKWCI
jgi:hypothetical protein